MTVEMMLNPQKYGLTQCPHCNGYGSSLKESCATCSRCGGSGLIKKLAALLIVLALGIAAQAQEPTAKPHAFFDRTNLALFSADALTRTLDAQSTRRFETAPCKCFQEDYIPSIANGTAKMYGYSLGVSAGVMGLSYLAHRTGHHRIERLIPVVDIVYDGRLVVGNYRLK